MAAGSNKPRPEYYNHCIASAMMLGVRIEYDSALPKDSIGNRWRVTLPDFPSELVFIRRYGFPQQVKCRWYKTEGYAAEGALAVYGFAVRRRKLIKITS